MPRKRGRNGGGGGKKWAKDGAKRRRTDQPPSSAGGEGRGWIDGDRKNEMFERYYKSVSPELFQDGQDWDQFMESLKTDLPTTFRLTAHSPYTPLLREKLENYFLPQMNAADVNLDKLPW